MIKIILHTPNFEDGTSFYRAGGPFGRLRKRCPGIDLAFMPKYTAATVALADIVVIQRPYDENAVQLAQLCKLAGTKVWVDYDDDIFQVTTSHPFAYVYNSYQTKSNVKSVLQLADVVTASTEALKEALSQFTKRKILVIPNAIDDEMPAVSSDANLVTPRNPVILFRGSASHEKDLLEVSVEVIDILRENPKFQFHAMGYLPWFIVECIPANQWQFTPWMDPYVYYAKLIELRPTVVIHPLEDTKFNRSKSNCSWLETTVAGSPFITRKLPEFEKPGCLTYTTPSEFKEALQKIVKGEYPTNDLVKLSWDAAMSQYRLREVNKLRAEVISELSGRAVEYNNGDLSSGAP